MPFNADLHMHSSVSTDGEIPPEKLVGLAAAAGIKCMAITDHNRIDGVAPALAAGRNAGIIVIPGIEIDSDFNGATLHILGYGVDHTNPAFATLWENVRENEQSASKTLIEKVAAMDIAFDHDKVWNMAVDGIVTAERVAEAALADPRNDNNPLLEPFRPGAPRSDNPLVNFYWDLCAPGKPAHVPVNYITLTDCVKLITDSGGVPVLAHPGQSLKHRPDSLPEIAGHGVLGLEAFSSYHDAAAQKHWLAQAKNNGLFVTCGSDFHGKTKPAVHIGRHGAEENTEKILAGFFEALA